ncbi:putative RNA-directed DNA polymerase [Helianthus annuus]|nr:putative RNA-directed DNA polymerase [Helianthus annuus]
MFSFKPTLSHLRNFGCLCFSTVLNETDKFAYHADKCVLIGYSNVKKGYKLWNLDEKKVFYSRDVKLYESVYPFKTKNWNERDLGINNELDHTNFFDCYETFTPSISQSPNDEERESGSHDILIDDQQPIYSSTSATSGQVDQSDSTLDRGLSSSNVNPDMVEDTGMSNAETNPSEGNVPSVRRSSRNVTLPKRLDGFVLGGKVKYEMDKVVNYSCLSADNFCLVNSLNKIIEPNFIL